MAWLKEMVSDRSGNISSKRVVTLLSFVLCATAFISNLYWGFEINKESFDSMMYIVIAGMGFSASERFSPKQGEEK